MVNSGQQWEHLPIARVEQEDPMKLVQTRATVDACLVADTRGRAAKEKDKLIFARSKHVAAVEG